MENNPYQAPESDLGNKGEFKRSIWWKIYFFFITILSALGMVSLFAVPGAGITEYINLAIWLIATAGLFGFVFVKPIHKPEFWLQILIVSLVFSVAYYFITDINLRAGMSETEFYISSAIGWLFSLPSYYALYAYSKSSNPAWKNA